MQELNYEDLVQTIYMRLHYAVNKWYENGLEPKYIQLNRVAYRAYAQRRQAELNDFSLPNKVFNEYPIILDLDSGVLIKVIGSARIESSQEEDIKKIRDQVVRRMEND